MSILVVDLGATKALLGVAHLDRESIRLQDTRSYPSLQFETFDDVLKSYLASIRAAPSAAVLAVAGPIREGHAKITNLPWQLSERDLETSFGFGDVRLINDVEAIAWSISELDDSDTHVIQSGEPSPTSALAVIAPGTGLGEAFLTWDGDSYIAHPSEGGHADFAPVDAEQWRLLEALAREYGRVSTERVCSGVGIATIYRWLRQDEQANEDPSIEAEIARASDITPVIIRAATSDSSSLCAHAVRLFVDILAAEMGNVALKTLATGGVYLGGGIPLHVLPWLQARSFVDRFCDKGRFSPLLRRIPVRIIADPLTPLRGAAAYAKRQFPEVAQEVTVS